MRVAVQFMRDHRGFKQGAVHELRDQLASNLQKKGVLRIIKKPPRCVVHDRNYPDKMQRAYSVKE